MHRFVPALAAFSLLVAMAAPSAQAAATPTLQVLEPEAGSTITSTDIPVRLQLSNFTLSGADVGLPDKPDEGHVHVMLDGMTMGVLFEFYTTPDFLLPGRGITPGQHTLTFDLATNSHMDMEDTVTNVTIDYEPSAPDPLPAPATNPGSPSVTVISPADGATVGPQFTIQVSPQNFTPALNLEGKPDLAGFGHYHVFVDPGMGGMSMQGGMMSMAGMVGMPGSNTIPLDLSTWPNGKHTIMIEPVQDDHSPIQGATPAMLTINLQGAAGTNANGPFARDGRSLATEPASTQDLFTIVWGDRAADEWVIEHNASLGG